MSKDRITSSSPSVDLHEVPGQQPAKEIAEVAAILCPPTPMTESDNCAPAFALLKMTVR
jgi:hypothetical protein